MIKSSRFHLIALLTAVLFAAFILAFVLGSRESHELQNQTSGKADPAPTAVESRFRQIPMPEEIKPREHSSAMPPRKDGSWRTWVQDWAAQGKSYEELEAEIVRRQGKSELQNFRLAARLMLKDFYEFPSVWEEEVDQLPLLPPDYADVLPQRIAEGNWAAVREAIESGSVPANSRLRVNSSTTILQQAVIAGEVELVQSLLARGAVPLGEDIRSAAMKGDTQLIKSLIEAGGNMDYISPLTYENAFIAAVTRGHIPAAEYLRLLGQAIRPDPVGFDAMELTLQSGASTPEAINYLRSLGFALPTDAAKLVPKNHPQRDQMLLALEE